MPQDDRDKSNVRDTAESAETPDAQEVPGMLGRRHGIALLALLLLGCLLAPWSLGRLAPDVSRDLFYNDSAIIAEIQALEEAHEAEHARLEATGVSAVALEEQHDQAQQQLATLLNEAQQRRAARAALWQNVQFGLIGLLLLIVVIGRSALLPARPGLRSGLTWAATIVAGLIAALFLIVP